MLSMSMSIAPEPNPEARSRLLRPATVLFFALSVLLVVLAVAWQYGWQGRLGFHESDADARAQLQSASLMLRSGQYEAAYQQLHPLLEDPGNPLYHEGRLLQWHIAKTYALAQAPGSPARKRAMAALDVLLGTLYQEQPWTAIQWRIFAQDAFAIGAYKRSAEAWLNAAREDPASAYADKVSAARALFSGADGAAGGRILLSLASQEKNPVQQSHLFIQGVHWLEGSVGAPAALSAAENVLKKHADLWRDRQVLLLMARLAMADDKPELAARWLHARLLNKSMGVRQ